MQRSGSQKALLVISILNLVFNGLGILALLALGFLGGWRDIAGGAVSYIVLALVAMSLLSVLTGVLGIRAANDATKIMPVWVLAIIDLVCTVLALVMAFVNGTFGDNAASLIGGLVGSGLMFWIANNIKRQAGK